LQEGLKILAAKGSKIGVCATSMDGRGLKAEALRWPKARIAARSMNWLHGRRTQTA
jgi:sulfur relay (sulfurtransferase) complex TusBCD TusD component (DsrE family)